MTISPMATKRLKHVLAMIIASLLLSIVLLTIFLSDRGGRHSVRPETGYSGPGCGD